MFSSTSSSILPVVTSSATPPVNSTIQLSSGLSKKRKKTADKSSKSTVTMGVESIPENTTNQSNQPRLQEIHHISAFAPKRLALSTNKENKPEPPRILQDEDTDSNKAVAENSDIEELLKEINTLKAKLLESKNTHQHDQAKISQLEARNIAEKNALIQDFQAMLPRVIPTISFAMQTEIAALKLEANAASARYASLKSGSQQAISKLQEELRQVRQKSKEYAESAQYLFNLVGATQPSVLMMQQLLSTSIPMPVSLPTQSTPSLLLSYGSSSGNNLGQSNFTVWRAMQQVVNPAVQSSTHSSNTIRRR